MSLKPVNSFQPVSLTPAKNFRLFGYFPVRRINRRCQRHRRQIFRRWRIWQIRVICGTQNRLRMRGKYLNIFGEYTERIYAYMEMTQRGPWRIFLIRQEHKSVYIFVNTNFHFSKILSNYTIWDRLSQKTISRHCPLYNTVQ